jgi:hypothetical protein
MPRKKYVNGEYLDLTDEDEAEFAAMAAAADLDFSITRSERNGRLGASDWTQLIDSPADPAVWAVYRQALRDLPSVYSRVSEVVWPNDPPTQVIVDAEEAARLAAL